jgi:hypothetical protein
MELDEIKYLYLLFLMRSIISLQYVLERSSEFGDLEAISS